MRLTDQSVAAFTEQLAAREPVPGGGGAAATAGALGAALCVMVGNYTTGKKKYAQYEADVQRMMREAEEIRSALVALVDADADAFAPLSRAYAIPKDDPSRAEVMEEATRGACRAPAEMVRLSCRAVDLLGEMMEKGSVMLLSDVGCGAALCRAALECAAMNVYINTSSLADRALAEELEREIDTLLEKYLPEAERIAREVTRRLR